MTKQIDFQKYTEFVDAVTSDESRDFVAFSDRVVALDAKGANVERLLTGALASTLKVERSWRSSRN